MNEVIKTTQFFNQFRIDNLDFLANFAQTIQFLAGVGKLVKVRIGVHIFPSLVAPLSLRQFSFLTGSNKLIFVSIEQKVLVLVQ